jgi:O-antigen/teichoic acid export membrane protein
MDKSVGKSAVHGFIWSFLDNLSLLGIQFLVGIVLARILSPKEFGLIGIITVFIAISQSIVDCGFTNALVRKTDCRQTDYSTVFYCNLAISLVLTAALILSAGWIADMFKDPKLKSLIEVISICVVINALCVIQRTIFTKKVDFKKQMIISVLSSLISGVIGIALAYEGYGVWSLAIMMLVRSVLSTALFWAFSTWRPDLSFSWQSFRELFGFGSKLLVSGLIDTVYNNVYYIVIGKYFSTQELGYFTRAQQFQTVPSTNLTAVITRVSYPVMANLQSDEAAVLECYRKLLRVTMYITFTLMLGLASVSKSLILFTIGAKWTPSILYLELLCFVGMLYPLHAINLNMIQLKGRSDLFLELEIIKKFLAVPVIAIGLLYGIVPMIVAMIAESGISYFINSYTSGRLIGYSSFAQLRDILPSFLLALAMAGIVFAFGVLVPLPPAWMLLVQIALGGIVLIATSKVFKLYEYIYLEGLLIANVRKMFGKAA